MLELSPRLLVFGVYTAASFYFISGLLTGFVAVPLVLALLVLFYMYRFEQLPRDRLHRFASVFNLNLDSAFSASASSKDTRKRVILHRGGCIDAPENTLEAIREAAKEGVAGVEIDLQFTADGVGILLHDDTLERTTNASGDVREKTYDELQGVNAAARHKLSTKYKDVKIPTLEECLVECLRLNLLVFIDCKAFAEKTANLVDELFNKYPDLYDTAAVCSFFPNIIYTMRKKNPQVITALTFRRMSLSTKVDCITPLYTGFKHYMRTFLDYLNIWLLYAWTWRLCGNSFLLINKESLCRNEIYFWNRLGIHLLPWTVNSDVEKKFCMDHLGLPIITDGLNVLVQ